jgi:hypothetical protein
MLYENNLFDVITGRLRPAKGTNAPIATNP